MSEREHDSHAAKSNEQMRRDLRDYVMDWMRHEAGVDVMKLAALVSDAPAFQTLSGIEWWNVALIFAQELQRPGSHRG